MEESRRGRPWETIHLPGQLQHQHSLLGNEGVGLDPLIPFRQLERLPLNAKAQIVLSLFACLCVPTAVNGDRHIHMPHAATGGTHAHKPCAV
jgi:hypothetical protein